MKLNLFSFHHGNLLPSVLCYQGLQELFVAPNLQSNLTEDSENSSEVISLFKEYTEQPYVNTWRTKYQEVQRPLKTIFSIDFKAT